MIRFPNIESVLKFYQVWFEMDYKTPEEYHALIKDFYANGEVESVSQTNRSKEQVIKDLSQHMKVLHIKDKENNHD